jgi:uncharacterized pyridoxal phosphate-containing UPF0001 family protein
MARVFGMQGVTQWHAGLLPPASCSDCGRLQDHFKLACLLLLTALYWHIVGELCSNKSQSIFLCHFHLIFHTNSLQTVSELE